MENVLSDGINEARDELHPEMESYRSGKILTGSGVPV
jgi:hypothetical protein